MRRTPQEQEALAANLEYLDRLRGVKPKKVLTDVAKEGKRRRRRRRKFRQRNGIELAKPVKVDQGTTTREEYAKYMRSTVWKTKRKNAIKFYGGKCFQCGTKEHLRVHHLTYERFKCERMADLQVLCVNCHNNLHGRYASKWDDVTREFVAIAKTF